MLVYIDPGSGSMFIQIVIAAALAVPFFLRSSIASLINRVAGRDKKTTNSKDDK